MEDYRRLAAERHREQVAAQRPTNETPATLSSTKEFESSSKQQFSPTSPISLSSPAAHDEGKTDEEDKNEETSGDACRICSGGSELGRLFSPCKCTGSIRLVFAHISKLNLRNGPFYLKCPWNMQVHVECINTWRRMSANPKSYYECDMCKWVFLPPILRLLLNFRLICQT